MLFRTKKTFPGLHKARRIAFSFDFHLQSGRNRAARRFSFELGKAALVDLLHDRLDVQRLA